MVVPTAAGPAAVSVAAFPACWDESRSSDEWASVALPVGHSSGADSQRVSQQKSLVSQLWAIN
ncbi:MAG: hypothetical protein ACKO0N_03065, partial [Planctomycetota bacterium]